MKEKKIGICGSFSTGKSTIAKEISKKYDLDFVESLERKLIKEKEIDIKSLNLEELKDFQKSLVENILKEENSKRWFVTDTTLIDSLAYTREIDDIFFRNEIFKMIINEWFYYDIMFYTPLEFEIENDGVRHLDQEFREVIDKNIQYYLKLFNVKYYVLTWSVSERLDRIDRVLNKTFAKN